MKKVLLLVFLLNLTTLFAMEQDEKDTIKVILISVDKHEYILDKELAQCFPLLYNLMANCNDTMEIQPAFPWATNIILETLIRVVTICPLLKRVNELSNLKQKYADIEEKIKNTQDVLKRQKKALETKYSAIKQTLRQKYQTTLEQETSKKNNILNEIIALQETEEKNEKNAFYALNENKKKTVNHLSQQLIALEEIIVEIVNIPDNDNDKEKIKNILKSLTFLEMVDLIKGAVYFNLPLSFIELFIDIICKKNITLTDMQTIGSRTLPKKIAQQIITNYTSLTFACNSAIQCIAFSPTGRYIAWGTADGTLGLYELKERKCIRTFKASDKAITTIAWVETKYKKETISALASGSQDKKVKLWNIINDENCLLKIVKADDTITTMAWHNPKHCLLWVSLDEVNTGITNLKDLNAPKTKAIKKLKGFWQYSIACSPAPQSTLFAISSDNLIQIGDIQTSTCNDPIITGEKGNDIICISWDHAGEYIAGGLLNGLVKIWNSKTGICLHTCISHDNKITSIACSPSGSYFATASNDASITLWDWKSGSCIQRLKEHTDSINSISWSSNGNYIVSGSKDQTIKIWNINPPVLTLEQIAFCSMVYQNNDLYKNIQFKEIYKSLPQDIQHLIPEPQWVDEKLKKRKNFNDNNNNDYYDDENENDTKKLKTINNNNNNNEN
jgi:WD40 repeat protein